MREGGQTWCDCDDFHLSKEASRVPSPMAHAPRRAIWSEADEIPRITAVPHPNRAPFAAKRVPRTAVVRSLRSYGKANGLNLTEWSTERELTATPPQE
jgi:hypothetical protein